MASAFVDPHSHRRQDMLAEIATWLRFSEIVTESTQW